MVEIEFDAKGAENVEKHLADYLPKSVVSFLKDSGTRIVPIGIDGKYEQHSAEMRNLGFSVDAWPIPPAALFVVAEKTILLRSTDAMSTIHECGHALDLALGGDSYRSGKNLEIRQAYARATRYVTPYAASAIDEFWAENFRAFFSANSPLCRWAPVSNEMLKERNPVMHGHLTEVFARIEARYQLEGSQMDLVLRE